MHTSSTSMPLEGKRGEIWRKPLAAQALAKGKKCISSSCAAVAGEVEETRVGSRSWRRMECHLVSLATLCRFVGPFLPVDLGSANGSILSVVQLQEGLLASG